LNSRAGGISNFENLNVRHSTISRNSVGGGVFNAGQLIVVDSTISTNGTPGGGAGIWNTVLGSATIVNTTVSGNSALGSGGIQNQGAMEIINSTIFNNQGLFSTGGISNSGSIVLRNTIVAGNSTGVFVNGTFVTRNPDVSIFQQGAFISNGNNLIGSGSDVEGFINGVNGDLVGTNEMPLNPLLSSLADNGGTTKTHALLPGSPAIKDPRKNKLNT
jgi:hypothetical protein